MTARVQVQLSLPREVYDEVKARAAAEQRSMTQVASQAVIAQLRATVPPEHHHLLEWARAVFAPGQEAARCGYYITAWSKGREIDVAEVGTHLWAQEILPVAKARPVKDLPRLLAPTLVTEWPRFAASYGADPTLPITEFAALWVQPAGLLCSACSPDAPLVEGVVALEVFCWAPPFWGPDPPDVAPDAAAAPASDRV